MKHASKSAIIIRLKRAHRHLAAVLSMFKEGRPHLFDVVTRSIQGLAGAALIALAIYEVFMH